MLFLPHAVFTLVRGGDHFEFRVLDPYWLPLYLAVLDGCWGFRAAVCALAGRPLPMARVALGVALLYHAAVPLARHLSEPQGWSFEQLEFHPFEVEGDVAGVLRALPVAGGLLGPLHAAARYNAEHGLAKRQAVHEAFWLKRLAEFAVYEGARDTLDWPGQLTLQTGSIGVQPFHLPDVRVLDYQGLTDRTVASAPVERANRDRFIGHDRRAPARYLTLRRPLARVFGGTTDVLQALERSATAVRVRADLWMPIDLTDDGAESFGSRLVRLEMTPSTPNVADMTLRAGKERWRGLDTLGFLGGHPSEDWRERGPCTWSIQSGAVSSGHVGGSEDDPCLLRSPAFVPPTGAVLGARLGGAGRVGLRVLRDGQPVVTWSPRSGPRAVRLDGLGSPLEVELFVEDRHGRVTASDIVLYDSDRREYAGRWEPRPETTDESVLDALSALAYVAGTQQARGHVGVTVHDPERAQQGLNFYVSGHGPEALLVDMDGSVLHRWRRSFEEVWPDELLTFSGAFWRRARLFDDGSVLALFEGEGLVYLDMHSEVIWAGAR
ncbi:MAG: hypothetical protein GY884_15210 [Proteobacteria bacterium]|nr:hypothetical protein [Pseudomonadota bacterium]